MTQETITLTPRAQQQVLVFNALERGEIRMAEAAALIHGNRGRPSPRRVDDATRATLILFTRTTYAGVNHLHLTELSGRGSRRARRRDQLPQRSVQPTHPPRTLWRGAVWR